MSYSSQAEMVSRFGEREIMELTDRAEPHANMIDASVLQRALDDADAEINGYLAGRFTLPLPLVPSLLVRLASDVARYRLYDNAPTDEVRNRYTDAVKTLRDIAAGVVRLPELADAYPAPSGVGMPEFTESVSVFRRDS